MRLVLESILLHNFKSYKGTHHIKNIDKSFTAIVGPNGSGKSNVIDSILFVLGFRAKKMRQSTITDLIYKDEKRESECWVELIFNKFRIKRSSNSKYYIDDKERTSAEVIKLMMDEGVDMEHNRFLILQGEIESIAMMKPKEGLLVFLEDIIGTSVLKNQIEEKQKEIEESSRKIEEIKTTLAFVKKDFDHAEELKNENENALKKRVEYLSMKVENREVKKELLRREIQRMKESKESLEEEMEELKSKNEETRKIFAVYEEKYKKVKKELNGKEEAFLAAKREFKQAERQKELQKREEEKRKKLQKQKEEERKRREMKKQEIEGMKKEMQENEEELKEMEESRKVKAGKLAKEEKKIKKGDLKILKEKEDFLMKLLDKKAKISHERSKLKVEIEIKSKEIERLNKSVAPKREKIRSSENSVREKIRSSENSLSLLEEKYAALEKDISLTQKELQKRKNTFQEATQKKEMDKREEEMMRHFKGVPGVLGRLMDVGRISPEYDTALRTACSRLNNIIVDTTATADKVMEIIKKKNIPRSTVIVLEKMKPIPKLEKQRYLFEMVECKEEMKKVFYFALSDTLVCEDLKEAEALAFSGSTRRRVVTVDGKLIEKSGVMTGGRGRVKSYEEIEKSLRKMEEMREEIGQEISEIQENRKRELVEREVEKLEKEIQEIKKKEACAEKDASEDEHAFEETKKQIGEIKARMVDGNIRDLQTDLKIIEEKIEILENRNQEIKIQIAVFNDKEEEVVEEEEVIVEHNSTFESIASRFKEIQEEYNNLLSIFKDVQDEMNSSKKKMGENYHNEIDKKNKLEDLEEKMVDLEEKMNLLDVSKILQEIEELLGISKRYQLSIEKKENHLENILENMADEDLKDFLLKKKAPSVQFDLNQSVFEDYLSIKETYSKAKEDSVRITDNHKSLRSHLESLKNQRYDIFMAGFTQVSTYLKEIYKALTYGGNAQLELVDYLDPFSEGIVLAVMPPKKCWKNVSNLSGGEKTLSSLSLIFALHKFKPSPFYVMDEIDAALDYRNVCIISNYLKEMTKNSQFIVISLRNDMFEKSNSILGVYKTHNISKFLMINIKEIQKML
ncbi:Structural maintenance of chromosomes protein 4 [Nosema granulosis]|uniref:Structural maintenance of chromosomes protein 4 n=1 Tax=Nosema granulosis TaxID=83296 RepID=A0A9P6GZ42_9MICR|nr:Structural maintenance of chromosomes protein 4 [Nosema granulosis]